MAQSIKRNFIYNTLLNVSSVLFPLITAPYVSRVLEPDGVGLFNFANTYAGYFALVAMLGIPTYGVREVSKLRNNNEMLEKLVSELMSVAAISTLVVAIVYLTTIVCVEKLTNNYLIFLLTGFVIYLAPFKISWFFQGIENFGFITKVSLIVRSVCVIGLFLFVSDKDDLIIYVFLSILGTVLTDIWSFIRMWKLGIRPKFIFKGAGHHVKALLILFASSIAVSIYTVLDTLMLGFLTDYEEVGYYTNAMHMSKVLLTAVTSLSIVAVPRVSLYFKENDYKSINLLMNRSFSIVSFLAFPVSIGILCIAPVFVPLFFGSMFMGAVIPLMILSLLIIVIGFNNLTGVQILIGMGLDKLYFYSVLIGTITNFVMNFFMIPLWGAVGASVSSVIAEFIILLTTIIFVNRNTKITINKLSDIFKAFIGALFFIPLVLFLKCYFEGWWLVGFYVTIGAFSYLLVEMIFKNSTIELIKETVLNSILNKNNYHK